MIPTVISRVQIVDTIKLLSDGLAERLRDAVRTGLPVELDFEELLLEACAATGMEPRDYVDAVCADPDLYFLEKRTLEESVLGTADPGPYDVISRESPAGLPSNPHIEARWAFGGGPSPPRSARAEHEQTTSVHHSLWFERWPS
jgi:hypothetical protein